MENKYNLALVGSFVIGFIAIFITLIVWLTVGTQQIVFLPYRVITSESVSGLSINSPVDYRGVDVGRVVDISLDQNDPRFVTIILNIKEGTPIKSDTKAVLMSRGITGLINVGLTGGTPDAPNILPTEKDPIPRIKSGPSLAKRLDEAFNSITQSITGLSEQLNKIINNENAMHIANTLSNIDTISSNLADSSKDLQELIATSSSIVQQAKPKIETVFAIIDTFDGVASDVRKASDQLEIFLKSFNNVFDNWSNTSFEWTELANSTQSLLPNINSIVNELRGTFTNLNTLIQDIKRQPNALIMGTRSNPRGPGE